MARQQLYDAVFTKRESEELVLSFDLTDWMDSAESVSGDPTVAAYDRDAGTDVTSTVLDSSNDSLDASDVLYVYVQGGDDGDDVEIEINWDTDASPTQNITAAVLLRVRGK